MSTNVIQMAAHRGRPRQIEQSELAELDKLDSVRVKLGVLIDRKRRALKIRLTSGAKVEPGVHSAERVIKG